MYKNIQYIYISILHFKSGKKTYLPYLVLMENVIVDIKRGDRKYVIKFTFSVTHTEIIYT